MKTDTLSEIPRTMLASVNHALEVATRNGIGADDVILVGGAVMELLGLRPAADIDIILRPEKRRELEENHGEKRRGPFEAINLNEDVQVLKNPYRSIGITDETCFERDLVISCAIPGGASARIVRPELEFGKKLFRGREKDRRDVLLLQQYAESSGGWRWDLVPVSPVDKGGLSEKSGSPETKKNRPPSWRKTVKRAIRSIKQPGNALRMLRKGMVRPGGKTESTRRHRILAPPELCTQMMDIGTLLQLQFFEGRFNRYDTLVRLYTLERYLREKPRPGHDRDVFSFYNQMQHLRVQQESPIEFRALADSVEEKGFYQDRYPLILDSTGRLVDGSHRLASALAWGVPRLPVRFDPQAKGTIKYGRGWFEEREFSPAFLVELDQRIRDGLIASGAAFQLVLWPPAQPFREEVETLLRERFPVIAEVRDAVITDFSNFIKGVYFSDDIESWKVQKKLYHMRACEPVVSVFSFLVDDPRYRTKKRTQSYLSDKIAKLKAELRERYRDRVQDYVYDIIVHIGDNPSMNRDMVETLRNHGVTLRTFPIAE